MIRRTVEVKARRRRWPSYLRRTLLAALLLLLAAVYISTDHLQSFGGSPDDATLERMRHSPGFNGRKYKNAEPDLSVPRSLLISTVQEWLFGKAMRAPPCPLPLFDGAAEAWRKPPESGLRVTWLGHSTTLIEIDGANVLTDPMWGERASPSRWAGPRRFHPPPVSLSSLPRIDAVIISHDHYDHLDMDTVRQLAERGVVFHVPLGLGAHLAAWGVMPRQIVEQDWWEATHIRGGIDVISTPSRHFSGRGMPWRNGTHWTSWSIVGPKHRVFFSGDTGPTEAFSEIGQREGPFDIAMIEVGQWHPSWGDIHVGPAGALDAFAKLNAKLFFPIHWGTFELALHDWSEPAETATREANTRGVPITTPLLGQPVEPAVDIPRNAWWRALPPTAERCPG